MHTGNKRLLWQHLTTMVIDKIRKMSIKGVKLKSESFFSISPGVLELWRKNLRGADSAPPPGPDRVKEQFLRVWENFAPPPGIRPSAFAPGQGIRQKICPGGRDSLAQKNFPRGCPGGCTQLVLTET